MSEYVEPELSAEPRDYTLYIWGGIVLTVAILIGYLMWSSGQTNALQSNAHVQHILIAYRPGDPTDRQRALDLISDLRQQILAGASFAQLARDYSDDPMSGARGGDLGYRPKGVYDESFEDYVWTGEIGAISEIVTTAMGFHVIQILDRHVSDADAYERELEERALEELEGKDEAESEEADQ